MGGGSGRCGRLRDGRTLHPAIRECARLQQQVQQHAEQCTASLHGLSLCACAAPAQLNPVLVLERTEQFPHHPAEDRALLHHPASATALPHQSAEKAAPPLQHPTESTPLLHHHAPPTFMAGPTLSARNSWRRKPDSRSIWLRGKPSMESGWSSVTLQHSGGDHVVSHIDCFAQLPLGVREERRLAGPPGKQKSSKGLQVSEEGSSCST